jgi:hypothetical protein
MHPEKMTSVAIAMLTALGFVLATAPVASAQKTFTCTGTISDGSAIDSSLVVPPSATCTLTNVTVVGNVQVGTGARLNAHPGTGQTVTIDGNVVAHQCVGVDLFLQQGGGGMIAIGGNVRIQNCGFGFSSDVTIGGNFVCTDNNLRDGCMVISNVVLGNLTVDNNSSVNSSEVISTHVSGNVDFSGNSSSFAPVVEDNTIGGNLQCSGNSSGPGGGSNTVNGQKLDQCAGL